MFAVFDQAPPSESIVITGQQASPVSAAPAANVAEEKFNPKALEQFETILRKKDIMPGLVVNIKQGNLQHEIFIYVDNAWHYEPKQIRLQAAQNFWKLWAMNDMPDPIDKARISIRDINDNEVGGSRILAGSLIWVND
jgi:hypothetical protein